MNKVLNSSVKLLMGLLITIFIVMPVQANDEPETEFSAGTVDAISETSLSISDPYLDEQQQLVFIINSETAFENVASVAEINVGDEVYVDYVSQGDQLISVSIYKEMGAGDEVYQDDGMFQTAE